MISADADTIIGEVRCFEGNIARAERARMLCRRTKCFRSNA